MTFVKDEKGSIGILFALTSVAVFGIVGMAIDVGRAITVRANLQNALDAAVLSAAQAGDMSDGLRKSIGESTFDANMANHPFASNIARSLEVSNGVVTATASASTAAIVVQVLAPNTSTIDLQVAAGAAVGEDGGEEGRACLLALNTNLQYGIKINGGSGGSYITTTCGIWVNNTGDSINGNGGANITASYVAVQGDWDPDVNYSVDPTTQGYMADPFKNADGSDKLPKPSHSTCTHNNFRANGNNPVTLNPGVYCGGINISSRANVTFNPGTYVIKNGQFTINQGGSTNYTVSGNGVFLYFTGNNSRFDWGSNSKVQFKAPTSGEYAGILMWSDNDLSNAHRMGSHSQSFLQGAIYSPSTEIDIQCSGNVNTGAQWTVWVVESLQVSSGATLTIPKGITGSETPFPAMLSSSMTKPGKPARLTN